MRGTKAPGRRQSRLSARSECSCSVASLGGGTRPAAGSELTVEGALVSAVRRESGVLEVRLFNPTADDITVAIAGYTGWLVDLRGYPERHFEGSFELRAYGIATARLSAL